MKRNGVRRELGYEKKWGRKRNGVRREIGHEEKWG